MTYETDTGRRKPRIAGPRVRAGRSLALAAAVVACTAGTTLVAGEAVAGAATVGTWSSTAELATARTEAVAVLLGNGKVLVAGGKTDSNGAVGVTSSAELYDPSTGSWSATGAMPVAVGGASAQLMSNGDVLVAGGETMVSGTLTPTGDAEVYNPSSGTWSATKPLLTPEYGAVSAALSNGDVLVAGGITSTGSTIATTPVAEVYQPGTGQWYGTNGMPGSGVANATATVMSNGDVLVAGGETASAGTATVTNAAEYYNPSNSSWTSTPAMPAAVQYAAAALLSNGKVLVAGGSTAVTASATPTSASELYDPSSNSWSSTGALPGSGTYAATATSLPDGTVLYAGGFTNSSQSPSNTAVRYSTSTGAWSSTGSLLTARGSATATLLGDGNVLVAGGQVGTTLVTGAAELYDAGLPTSFTSAASATFTEGLPGSFTVTVSGSPTAAITLGGSLPAGLSFVDNKNDTATISGIPLTTSVGSSTVTLSASNGVGSAATQSLAITVLERYPAGYWYSTTNGSVQHQGKAALYSTSSKAVPHDIVSMAPTPDQSGYYLVSSQGNVYNYGDAKFYGSKAHARLTSPIVSVATTLDGRGYYMVTARGNIYNYGDAKFYGSPVHVKLPAPVIGFATTPDGKGYWLATASGAVYPYGDAHSYSSLSLNTKVRPVVGFAPSADGAGYYLVTSKGNVYNEGDARFYGSVASRRLPGPISAFATVPSGHGYYLVTTKGNIYNEGVAPFFGSSAHTKLAGAVATFTVYAMTK